MSVYQPNTPAPRRSSYSRGHRLRESELAAIKGVGKRRRTEHLSAHIASSLLPYCRVTVVVGKQGHTVVERNRLRRQLRELVRLHLIPDCTRINVILQAFPSAYDAGFKQLSDEVNEIKLQLVSPGGG